MNPLSSKTIYYAGLAAAVAAMAFAPAARANVYATNIKLNGSLTNTTASSSVSISYVLNEPATLGTTIKILSGTNVINTLTFAPNASGSLLGLNTVTWGRTNSSGTVLTSGTYGVSITAASSGFTNWTKTSLDSSNNVAVFPHGIAVNKNTNSPYYGRIVLGNSTSATQHGVAQLTGLYKFNADNSPADEGSFGFAGYTTNDNGAVATGQMASGTTTGAGNSLKNPYIVRIGGDDRIYWADDSQSGAIVACDMLATTNQIIICEGPGDGGPLAASVANPTSPNNYSGNPDTSLLNQSGTGIRQFDVIMTTTTNAALFLVDCGDFPSWGVWMWHMTNGASDTNDIMGTQAVATGGDVGAVTAAGISVDDNLDIFVSQGRNNVGDPLYRSFQFTNWNGGVLPPGGSGFDFAETTNAFWKIGSADNSLNNIQDTVINSRKNPTMVALPMTAGGAGTTSGGIRVVNAIDGSPVTVTNNSVIVQTLTNLDYPFVYTCAAWDNVGNLYGGSTTANYWRVFSPPGTNQATTVAVATVSIVPGTTPIVITGISVVGTSVTVNFTASSTAAASSFTLVSSSTAAGTYTPVVSAVVTQVSPGVFKATTTTSGTVQFYRIKG